MTKRILTLLLIISLTFSGLITSFAEEDFTITPDDINAKAAILIDAETGQILFEKNAYDQNFPASTTKLLTGLIIAEDSNLDDLYTVGDIKYDTVNTTNISLNKDEVISVRDLLYGLMIASGNDAAIALANYHSGTNEAFAKLMNQRAKELGALNSNFVNPNGLHEANHTTTAYDLAQIAKAAYNNPLMREICSTISYSVAPTNKQPKSRTWANTNKFLNVMESEKKFIYHGQYVPRYYPLVNGMKTGWTPEASACLISSATFEDRSVIVVVLGANDVYLESRKLIDYGLYQFQKVSYYSDEAPVKSLEIDNANHLSIETYAASPVSVMIPKTANINDVTPIYSTKEDQLTFPIQANTIVGSVALEFQGKVLTKVDLITKREITGKPFLDEEITTYDQPSIFNASFLLSLGIKVLLGLFLWRVLMVFYYTQKQKKKTRRKKRK